MRSVVLQLQNDCATEHSYKSVAQILSIAGFIPAIEVGTGYVNVSFKADNIETIWPALENKLLQISSFANNAIVVCEGENGWQDYQQLYQFGPQVSKS